MLIKDTFINIQSLFKYNSKSKIPLGYIELINGDYAYFYSIKNLEDLLKDSLYGRDFAKCVHTATINFQITEQLKEIIKKYYQIYLGIPGISPKNDLLKKFYQDEINKRNESISVHEQEMLNYFKKHITFCEDTKIRRLVYKENVYYLSCYN